MSDKLTDTEYTELFNEKLSIVVEINALDYTTLQLIADTLGITIEDIAGRALILGIDPLIKDIRQN